MKSDKESLDIDFKQNLKGYSACLVRKQKFAVVSKPSSVPHAIEPIFSIQTEKEVAFSTMFL